MIGIHHGTQNMLRAYEVKYVFSEKKIGFDESFDVTKSKYLIYTMCAHSILSYHII